jgi:addiction module HigA family antidote
MAMPLMWK